MQPALYTIVPERTIRSMAETFYACIHLPIQIINEEGKILVSIGDTPSFCRLFQRHLPATETCEKLHASASRKAVSLGEPYIFACHADLNHIVFPLISKQTFLGSILVGPFLMDEPDSILISDVAKRYRIPMDDALDLYDETRELPVIEPGHVNHISHLLFYLFSSLIAESREELRQNNQKLLQQSQISESIQRYKGGSIRTDSYPYEKEKALIAQVKRGDVREANAVLNDLLGYVLFSQGNSLDVVKSRAIELCSLLSRTAIEGGAPTDSILKLNNHFLQNLQQINTLDTLCYKLQEIVETFSESMFNYIPSRNSELIKKAMLYISEHFSNPLTLEEVAAYVHLHPSYFSTLFKSSTGSSFKEYLNMVRIEESKRLLSNTDYSIIDIAVAVGFEDQSYFSKVFKKYTGLTPKQFR
ncbi:MAG TPA: PocR ligand-binding domain-containing protein [Candidatus Mediterraneibacter faecavium]|uniref:PocR ligand-binding domain-containing protein n=1 Tax=Candidatus Mediterraneibacter faecavium TaxID=2838668 RepID=A0A9D2TNZ3_9FIRM|nr:PocR ligand-binding domain-containing protein [Candidatus Mediterraneibacter faecavium]